MANTEHPVNMDEPLYDGCTLRMSDWAKRREDVHLVVGNGGHVKLMRNGKVRTAIVPIDWVEERAAGYGVAQMKPRTTTEEINEWAGAAVALDAAPADAVEAFHSQDSAGPTTSGE